MEITCTILCNDDVLSVKLKDFVTRTPFLSLCGIHQNPIEALTAYYESPVQLYFINIEHGEMDSFQFCQLLKATTRVIFTASSKEHAADCFRLDALDYLLTPLSYPIFLEAVSKALRWFSIQTPLPPAPPVVADVPKRKSPFLYIKSEYRVVRLDLEEITYIESMGDYIKIYFQDGSKPVLSLCSMKNLESMLPKDDFIRVHRSYIVRKECIKVLEHGNIIFDKVCIPIGDSYRKQFQEFFSKFSVL